MKVWCSKSTFPKRLPWYHFGHRAILGYLQFDGVRLHRQAILVICNRTSVGEPDKRTSGLRRCESSALPLSSCRSALEAARQMGHAPQRVEDLHGGMPAPSRTRGRYCVPSGETNAPTTGIAWYRSQEL